MVWWSIATALTPVAAKLGLPFLLVVRAFMGIGEVTLGYSGSQGATYFQIKKDFAPTLFLLPEGNNIA